MGKNLLTKKLGATKANLKDMKEAYTVFNDLGENINQIQDNQLEFEAYLKACVHNQNHIMKVLKIEKDFKGFNDYFENGD